MIPRMINLGLQKQIGLGFIIISGADLRTN